MLKYFAVCGALLLTGCSAMQNISSTQIRNKESLRLSETLPMTIPQIQAALFQNRYACRPLPHLYVDPADANRGLLVIEIIGASRVSVGALADFKQSGANTQVDFYSYYSGWDIMGKELIAAIKQPLVCN